MARIGVVINANSRKNRRRPLLASEVSEVIGPGGIVRVTSSLAELPVAVDEMVAAGAEVLAAAGGDGALHHLLNVLHGRRLADPSYPLLPLVPTNGGTIDFVAKRVGLRGGTLEILARLRGALERGALERAELPSLSLVGERIRASAPDGFAGVIRAPLVPAEGPFDVLGFALAAGGVGQRFFEQFYALPDPSPLGVVAVIGRVLASQTARSLGLPAGSRWTSASERVFRPTEAHVWIDGVEVASQRHSALHAGAFDVDLGGVVRVFPLAREPGVLHLHAGHVSPWEVLKNLPRIAAGGLLRAEGLVEMPGREMVIESMGEEALAPVLDGEIYAGVSRLEVRPGPRIEIALP